MSACTSCGRSSNASDHNSASVEVCAECYALQQIHAMIAKGNDNPALVAEVLRLEGVIKQKGGVL